MAATQIGNVVTPEIITDYVVDELPYYGSLTAAGVVVVDSDAPFVAGGKTFTVPHLAPLSTTMGESQHIEPNTNLAVKNVTTYAEEGVISRFGDVLGFEDAAILAAGENLPDLILPQLTQVIARDVEHKLINTLHGVFGLTEMEDHIYDDSGNGFSVEGLSRAKGRMGEARNRLRIAFINSAISAYLEEYGLTKFLDIANFGERILLTGQVPTLQNLAFIENNTIAREILANEEDPESGTGVYETWIMGGQPLYLGYQRELNIEYDRDIRLGGGTDLVKWDLHYAPHVKGTKWLGPAASVNGPTSAELANSAKWEKVATRPEDIPIVRYLSRIPT